MALNDPCVDATLRLRLKKWGAPNFALQVVSGGEEYSIPIRDLGDALDEMAWAWLDELYKKAGRANPFSRPVGKAP